MNNSHLGHVHSLASNRQKKVLRFFGIPFSTKCSVGAAGWEIGAIMENEECRRLWKAYLFLTKDFDSVNDELMPFNLEELKTIQMPADWDIGEAFRQFKDELVDNMLKDESPFDRPQPNISFEKRTFMFTGKFGFGTRKACQDAIISRGGNAPDCKEVSHFVHYLVIGTEGSKAWRKQTYGNKIEAAILARREHGTPAIVSEDYWATALRTI